MNASYFSLYCSIKSWEQVRRLWDTWVYFNTAFYCTRFILNRATYFSLILSSKTWYINKCSNEFGQWKRIYRRTLCFPLQVQKPLWYGYSRLHFNESYMLC